jgi:hypothetical protein
LSLSGNTTYYWHVTAANQNGSSGYSATWRFTTAIGPPVAPILLLPADRQDGVSETPTLTWSPVMGAKAYNAQLSTNSEFSTIILNDSTITSDSVKLAGLSNDSTYYWRVNAGNAVGIGPWSTISRFTVASTAAQWKSIPSIHELRAYFSSRSSMCNLMILIPDNYQSETRVTLCTIAGKRLGAWRLYGNGIHKIFVDGYAAATRMYVCRIVNGSRIVIRKIPGLLSQ